MTRGAIRLAFEQRQAASFGLRQRGSIALGVSVVAAGADNDLAQVRQQGLADPHGVDAAVSESRSETLQVARIIFES